MKSNKYIPTIGLEIHAELKTSSKMFCACKNDPDEEKPNSNICEICLGHPGTLPVLNLDAIRKVLSIGVAVNGKLADFTEWDRKHYFYPDIPKGYQISQYKYPLVSGGTLAGVEIERIHLEEDTAQSTHDIHEKSLVNFNRSGVPLMELVTKPVIHDALTAVRFAKELQLLLRYLDAGEANMEKGEMRVEANVSVGISTDGGPVTKLGTKTEIKNLNSFKSVEKAIAYETWRQTSLLQDGHPISQETRGWDDVRGETYAKRSKESSHDYRYFPDPDIPKMKLSGIDGLSLEEIKRSLPELPWVKRDRYMNDYKMTAKEIAMFIESERISEYFDKVISNFKGEPRKIRLTINYILSEYLGLLKKQAGSDSDADIDTIPAASFAEVIDLVANGDISSRGAKDLLTLLIHDTKSRPRSMAEKNGLIQNSNADDLIPIIQKIITDNAKVVAEYKSGKEAALQYLIGQAMKATKSAGNPEIVKKLLISLL